MVLMNQNLYELKVFEEKAITFKKNSTSAMFAKGFMEYINSKQGLEDITIVGCCTDICVLNLAIPLKNYFNEQNIDTNVIVMEDLVETYNIPNVHDNKEYNEMGLKLMKQAGVIII